MTDPPISEFMNRGVLSGDANTSLRDVVEMMFKEKESAFVACEDGFPIGIITERDTLEVLQDGLRGQSFQHLSAKSIMASPLHTLTETSTMGEVIEIMNEQRFRRVPIVDEKNRLSGIVNLLEIQAATNKILAKRKDDLEQAVRVRTAELEAANDRLEELSLRDGLTELLNRRAMALKLEELQSLSVRYGNPYTVILCDIDHFKPFNDRLGHPQGDAALIAVAQVMSAAVRISDSVYRYGGEEFLIALPETDEEGAMWVAERVRSRVEHLAIPHPASSTADVVTLSCGLSEARMTDAGTTENWHRTVARADQALYRAKGAGRNRIIDSSGED